MEESIKLRKKICLLGDAAVGKTSLIRRFVFNEFDDKYITTIGTNVSKKDSQIILHDENNKLQKYDLTMAIWDIIGQREFHTFNLNYFRNANGGLVVCDITRRETLDNLDIWASSFFNTIGQVPLVFLVNKYDLRNQAAFEFEEVGAIAEKFNASFFVTSALTSENVEASFYTLGELMVSHTIDRTKTETEVSKIASEIIVEFSNNIGGIERGIPLIKEIFKGVGVDFLNPQKEQLERALPELVQLLRDLQGSEVAERASSRFNELILKLN